MRTVSILVAGRVQGVFFRKYTRDTALKYGLTGFVKNQNDGSVYIEVSGSEAAIAEFEKWCHKGSPGSKVEQVKSQQIPEKQFSGFDIRYGNN